MIVDLANVGDEPKLFEAVFTCGEIDLDDGMSLAGDAHLVGEFALDGDKTELTGKIEAGLDLDCTRCLEPVTRHFSIPFRDVFVLGDSAASESEVAEEALDESIAVDGTIDLAEVVREQILLAVPEKVLCREDCKGLCSKCGASLNLIDCKCADEEIDPRWAALKGLK